MTVTYSSGVCPDSGGMFITKFASPVITITAGATGTITTLTPPNGQSVKVTALASVGATLTSLTTVTVDGVDVISEVLLDGVSAAPSATNELVIGFAAGNHSEVVGDVNEVIEIKTNIATSSDIKYSYEFGV